MPEQTDQPSPALKRESRPPDPSHSKPWRTEGLPEGQVPKKRPRWLGPLVMFLGYAVFFGILTLQDRQAGPESISYTEFKTQIANKNVAEVFARGDTIQGSLRKAAPLPGQKSRTYQQFSTGTTNICGR